MADIPRYRLAIKSNESDEDKDKNNRPILAPRKRPTTSAKARVLYDYQADESDEITLGEGEHVEVSFDVSILIPF